MRTWSRGFLAVLGLAACLAAVDLWRSEAARRVASAPSAEDRAASAQREADFQRVLAVAQGARRSVKNPPSFVLDGAWMMPTGVVCLQFHATNSFGGVVPGHIAVGSQNEIWTDAPAWSRECKKGAGADFSFVRRALD